MNRGASAAVQSQWAAQANSPAHLYALAFDEADGGTQRFTDAARPISWGGNVYTALGQFLSFSGLTESLELRVADIRLQISGVDQTEVAVFLQRECLNRQLLIHQMFLDPATHALVVDPVPVHDGRMDEPRIVDDLAEGSTIIEVASHDQFADFERLSGRHTNSTDQALHFPGDECFKNLAMINSRSFSWGHIKEPAATGMGAALTRIVNSDFLKFKF